MHKNGTLLALALLVGAFLGACFRDAVKASLPATAYAQGQRQYKVIYGNLSTTKGYEEDLNENAAQGWTFVGVTPHGHLILTR